MSRVEWHLDVVQDGNAPPLLVVIDQCSMMVEREEIAYFTRIDVLDALRTIMMRTVRRPDAIVTDNARQWFGVADAIGAGHRYYLPGQPTELERIARGLISNSQNGGAA
ncbi:MAG: hypothetical protein AB7E60_01815 [Sphingobium sp.]